MLFIKKCNKGLLSGSQNICYLDPKILFLTNENNQIEAGFLAEHFIRIKKLHKDDITVTSIPFHSII